MGWGAAWAWACCESSPGDSNMQKYQGALALVVSCQLPHSRNPGIYTGGHRKAPPSILSRQESGEPRVIFYGLSGKGTWDSWKVESEWLKGQLEQAAPLCLFEWGGGGAAGEMRQNW